MRNKLFIFMFFFIVSSVFGQSEPVKIRGFAGLNTRAGDFSIKPNEARIAHNIDFGRNVGSITKRYGYDSVSGVVGMDSILHNGIYAGNFEDGTQRLFVVTDSTGVGYGGVYMTAEGSDDIGSMTKIWDYWSPVNPPYFTTYKDNIFIVNGSHHGIVYNHNYDVARQFPSRAPGEPLIIPIKHTGGELNGEYLYMIASEGYTYNSLLMLGYHLVSKNPTYKDGMISARIKVNDGRVLIRDIPKIIPDSTTHPNYYNYYIKLTDSTGYEYKFIIGDDTAKYTAAGGDDAEAIRDSLVKRINANSMRDSVTAYSIDDIIIRVAHDSIYRGFTASVSGANMGTYRDESYDIFIYRTKANPGVIDKGDSVILIKTVSIPYYNDSCSVKILDTLTVIDSIADADLPYSYALYTRNDYGRDTAGQLTYRYSAPRYVKAGMVIDTNWGIYNGWDDDDTFGVVYTCSYIDTITNIESDTGRSLFVYYDNPWGNASGTDTSLYYKISLPVPPDSNNGCLINLYRAPIRKSYHDSTFRYDSAWLVVTYYPIFDNWNNFVRSGSYSRWYSKEAYKTLEIVDSLYAFDFRLVEQLPPGTEDYIDNMRHDNLIGNEIAHKIYHRQTSPSLLSQLFSFQNRLWAVSGSKLYYSNADLPTLNMFWSEWNAFDVLEINPGDGDEGVLVYPMRDFIRYFKNNSSYIIYPSSEGFNVVTEEGIFLGTQVSDQYGCIAPFSHQPMFGGHCYLSKAGVVIENEGSQLERSKSSQLLSAPLKNFDNLSLITKRKAMSVFIPEVNKYLLCIGDTTYVYDGIADAWSTWGLKFAGACLYSTEDDVTFYPGDTMYFIMPGDSLLYKYGTSEYDNRTADPTVNPTIQFTYKSGPMEIDNKYKNINAFGTWFRTSLSNMTYNLTFYEHTGDSLNGYSNSSLNDGYNLLNVMTDPFMGFSFKYTSPSSDNTAGSRIDGFDIYLVPSGEYMGN